MTFFRRFFLGAAVWNSVNFSISLLLNEWLYPEFFYLVQPRVVFVPIFLPLILWSMTYGSFRDFLRWEGVR